MADLTGKTLGKYRLVERLGRGGMAEVYKAYQPGLDRHVAVKLMHGYLAEDEDFVGRFHREARAIASLHHPHIVQVHDFDVDDDVYFMVQEYIEGGTLKARLEQARRRGETLPHGETLRVLVAICSAIDYAHAQGRVHRDIKPDNIMFDATDRPVLTDFGIASIVGGTRLTATGAMVGTPAYMSPEQGRGDRGDTRSDIYSLGVVLYEMVTGSVPFDADTPFAVVLKHLNEPLPLPRSLKPGLSLDVERVILKALAKDPEDRFQSAAALAEALALAVREAEGEGDGRSSAGKPTRVAETTLAETVAPLTAPSPPFAPARTATAAAETTEGPSAVSATKRRLPLWPLVGASVLVMVLALSLGVWILSRANQQSRGAPATAASGTRATHGADQGTAPEVAALIQAGNEILGEECDGDVDEALSLYERAIQQDEDAAAAYVGRALCRWCNADNGSALEDLDRAIELDPTSAVAHYWRGRVRLDLDRQEESLGDLERAIELDPAYATAHYWRALVSMWYTGDWEQALADLYKVIELDPGYAMAYLYRGQVQWGDREDTDAALADYSTFVELEPDSPEGYAGRGEVYLYGLEDYERAVTEYTLAIERDPTYANFYVQRAWAHSVRQAFDLAIADLSRALEVEPEAQTHFFRGAAYLRAGQHGAALDDFDKAVLLDWEGKAAAYLGKGKAYFAQGQYAEAIAAYDRAAEGNWEDYIQPHLGDIHLLLERAAAYRESGRFEDALGDLTGLAEERDGWFRPYYDRAATYQAMGDVERALADLVQAWEYADSEEWRVKIEEEIQALRED